MIKTVTKIGNSYGIIFDRALLDLAQLKPGDEVNVTVRPEGTIMMEPLRGEIAPQVFEDTVEGVLNDYNATLERLS